MNLQKTAHSNRYPVNSDQKSTKKLKPCPSPAHACHATARAMPSEPPARNHCKPPEQDNNARLLGNIAREGVAL
jgi:hypothetical protein